MARSAQRSEPVNDQQRHELHARAVKARRRAEQREQARQARDLAERLERLSLGRMDDPKLLPDQQDKRSVIAIEAGDVDQWLEGTVQEASQLLKAPAVDLIQAGPA